MHPKELYLFTVRVERRVPTLSRLFGRHAPQVQRMHDIARNVWFEMVENWFLTL
tara:strand:- start:43 stop:204 length:162 start_codon:yes stop_codon:yes gene_type:complete